MQDVGGHPGHDAKWNLDKRYRESMHIRIRICEMKMKTTLNKFRDVILGHIRDLHA